MATTREGKATLQMLAIQGQRFNWKFIKIIIIVMATYSTKRNKIKSETQNYDFLGKRKL